MELDINNLISFFKKNTISQKKDEFTEQEAAGAAPSGGGGAAMPKWADTVGGPKRGKANMLGKKGEKWSSGLNRGVANQVW
jgi:hypothetical protein